MRYLFLLLVFILGNYQIMQANIDTSPEETKRLKKLQIDWLDEGRDIFELTTTEVDKLETIADSSRGSGGAQARAILSFAFDTTYFYTNCVTVPDTSQKSSPIIGDISNKTDNYWIIASPNPANNYIKFNYSIGDKLSVVLRLYDQNGVLIDNILLEKGTKSFRYNSSNYKSGIYYYSTTTEKEILTGKIVILN